jgi:HlyD family secretion protein
MGEITISESPADVATRAQTTKTGRRAVTLAAGVAVLGLMTVGARTLWHPHVNVAVVERGAAIDAVYGTGSIEAVERVDVKARVAGPLTRIVAHEGDRVEESALLAWVDAPTLRNDVVRGESELAATRGRTSPQLAVLQVQQRTVEAQLDQARLELARAGEAARLGANAPQDLERAKLQVGVAEGQLAANKAQQVELRINARAEATRAETGLSSMLARAGDAEVRAPIAGVVLKRYVELGEVVGINENLFRIGDTSHLEVEAIVDETDIGRVRVGMEAALRVSSFEDRTIRARVRQITPEANRERKRFRVDLDLVDAVEGLRPGMSAECNIILAEHDEALLLPADAVHGDQVWLVGADGSVHRRTVAVGLRDTGRVEISDGLGVGDLVVLGDESVLSEGKRVVPSAPSQTATVH